MRKILVLFMVALMTVSVANAKSLYTYLDYLNTDAIADNPGFGVGLGNDTFTVNGGFFANRADQYDFNLGATLYAEDLFGRLMFNSDLDPALRVGVNVDIASSVYGEVGYEWLYYRDDTKFYVEAPGTVTLTLGLRW